MADRGPGPDSVARKEEVGRRVEAKQEEGGKVEAKQRKKASISSISSSSSLPPLTYSLIEEAKLTIAR